MFSFLYVASFTKDVHVSMPWAEVFPVCGWPATRPHFPLRQDPTTRTSHRHHHPFPHRTTDTRGDADRRPPCADDPGVEWPLGNNQPQVLLPLSSHGRMRCLCLCEQHPSPGGSSLHFPSQQGTLRLHGFHEEALRRNNRLDSYCAQLPGHPRRGRALPQTSADSRIKASDGQAAQRLGGDVSEQELHRQGWSESLGWRAQNEQVHPLERDRMGWIDTDGLRLSKGAQRVGDGLGNALGVPVL